jgi:hypothetical protein
VAAMIPVLLWIVGCYALAAVAVHAALVFSSGQSRDVLHYVLIAGNEQLQMEWYMRSLRRFSHFTGREVKVTVVDHGSEDETIGIARFFARYGMKVDIKSGAPLASTLGRAEGASKEVHEMNECSKSKNRKQPAHRKQTKGVEPTSLMWMLQAEGIITESEHAVLIDLRDPAELSKLPL